MTATAVSIDALMAAAEGGPAPYGGSANLDAVITGLPRRPSVAGQLTVTDGRIWRVAYDRLAGKVAYSPDGLDVDGTWDVLCGPIVFRALTGAQIPKSFVDRLVDGVLGPAKAA